MLVGIKSLCMPTTLLILALEGESVWSEQKERLKRQDPESYLDKKMWWRWRGGSYDVIMRNFLVILPLQFPTDTPVLWFIKII